MGVFDIHPQKFYLLSSKKRTLIDFSTADYDFAKEVDQVFFRQLHFPLIQIFREIF